jgi:hypothetical protein
MNFSNGSGSLQLFLSTSSFFWVMIYGMLNTRDLLKRKIFTLETNECVLCDDHVNETMMHLFFFSCDCSQNLWWKTGEKWNTDI